MLIYILEFHERRSMYGICHAFNLSIFWGQGREFPHIGTDRNGNEIISPRSHPIPLGLVALGA